MALSRTYGRERGWTRTFGGVIVAMLTPFDAGGALDLEQVEPYVDFLVASGVAGIMVGGTTSEFIALSTSERAKLITAVVAAVAGRVKVIAHIGHVFLSEALFLAESAANADALAAIVPYFHSYTQSAIVDHLRALAKAVPELPFFVYNYPAATGNRLDADAFAELLDEPNVAGTKLSMATMGEIEPFMRFMPEICVVSGNDTVWKEFVAKGGRAVVSGNASAFPELMVELLMSYEDSDRARSAALQALADEVVLLSHAGAPDRLKALIAERGLPLGAGRIRSVGAADLKKVSAPSDALRQAFPWKIEG
jgi:4-hydroxy-tetrahydrodipicolinate synthase